MLVLSRKQDQRIYVGDDIVIVIVAVRGGTVRVGIEAPKHVRIVRDDMQEDEREHN